MSAWRDAALVHAQSEYPREACGLVVKIDGVDTFRPCLNQAQDAAQHFVIAAHDYAEAEDAGEIIAVFHSHPNAPCHPSEADRVACEASGLPWHIVGLPSGQWSECAPSGYLAPLEGRPFVHGILDCYSLVRDYYQRVMGITLPDYARADDWWQHGGNLYRDNFRAAGFREIELRDAKVGDMILMQVQAPVENHAAILLDGNVILHHLHGRLSCRETYAGYWRKVTRTVLRHADA